jgi:hypothetical protein
VKSGNKVDLEKPIGNKSELRLLIVKFKNKYKISLNQEVTRRKSMMKYYSIRILAALSFMGSFGGGLLAGAEYGKWVGWTTFIILAGLGIILDRVADKIRELQR